MDADIKQAFINLSRERENLTKTLNDKLKGLKSWPLFNAACVIAENYQSDVRKKLRLNIAADHLKETKTAMVEQGVSKDTFAKVEKALNEIIHHIASVTTKKYKSTVSEIREKMTAEPESLKKPS